VRVLVIGAHGFIGSAIAAALKRSGHEIVRGVRASHTPIPGEGDLVCDMACDVGEETWLPRLDDIDAVVNCAGILRERNGDTFETVHVQAPLALFRACVRANVRRVVQISALGDPRDGEFIASKHRSDAALANLALDWVILRPSVVYSTRGSYGGTSLLRALAALPCLAIPGDGESRLQPIAIEDLAGAVSAILERPDVRNETFELVGPNVVTLAEYLRAWRAWLGYPSARECRVSSSLLRVAAQFGEWFGRGPFGLTMLRMLERGNVGAPDAWERVRARLGVEARSLDSALAEVPSQTQDRWHARAYFWLPALRIALAILWIASGALGLLLPAQPVDAVTLNGPLAPSAALMLARFGGGADLVLGVLCLVRWRPRVIYALMVAMLAIYTISIGIFWPRHWLDPFGGLAKNIPLLAALGLLWATEERR
jgi:uncharacterized protein YbjT (DUF2867 family)